MKKIKSSFMLAGILLIATACGGNSDGNEAATVPDVGTVVVSDTAEAAETDGTDEILIPSESAEAADTEDTQSVAVETSSDVAESSDSDAAIPSNYDEYIDSLQYLSEIEDKIPLAMTTLEMVETRQAALEAWDAELNKMYGLVLTSLNDEEAEELRAEERLWIAARDWRAEQVHDLGGSLAKVDYTDLLFVLTKERTLELAEFYYGESSSFNSDLADKVVFIDDIVFEVYEVNEKYYGATENSYIELDLLLPGITGDYAGIPTINEYFATKKEYFYNELPFDYLLSDEQHKTIEGRSSGYFISAYYYVSAKFGNIICISASLDGGAGGVSWAGWESNAFDLTTSKKLTLSDVFSVDEEEYMEFIYEYVTEGIAENIRTSDEEWGGYSFKDAYSEEGTEKIRGYNRDNFILESDCLVIFYDKYELADGAAGVQYFDIPYTEIADILAIDVSNPSIINY